MVENLRGMWDSKNIHPLSKNLVWNDWIEKAFLPL